MRPYSHSLSDDEKLYKTAAERAEEATRDPITKFAAVLKSHGLATDADLAAMAKDVDREIAEAADAAVKAPKPAKDTAGLWVLFAGCRSDARRPSTRRLPAEGKPDTMVSAHQPRR